MRHWFCALSVRLVAAFGANAAVTIYWAIYGALMPRASAAAGIAVVNSIGNLSGFAGPYLIGAINDSTGSFSGGLQVISLFGLIAFCILLAVTPAGAGRASVPLAAKNVPQ